MKSLTAFCLGAVIMYLLTMSVERKPKRKPSICPSPTILVEPLDTIDPDAVARDILGPAIRTLHQFGQEFIALQSQPRTLKGVFANHGR